MSFTLTSHAPAGTAHLSCGQMAFLTGALAVADVLDHTQAPVDAAAGRVALWKLRRNDGQRLTAPECLTLARALRDLTGSDGAVEHLLAVQSDVLGLPAPDLAQAHRTTADLTAIADLAAHAGPSGLTVT